MYGTAIVRWVNDLFSIIMVWRDAQERLRRGVTGLKLERFFSAWRPLSASASPRVLPRQNAWSDINKPYFNALLFYILLFYTSQPSPLYLICYIGSPRTCKTRIETHKPKVEKTRSKGQNSLYQTSINLIHDALKSKSLHLIP